MVDFWYVIPEYHPDHICKIQLVTNLLSKTPQIELKVLYYTALTGGAVTGAQLGRLAQVGRVAERRGGEGAV